MRRLLLILLGLCVLTVACDAQAHYYRSEQTVVDAIHDCNKHVPDVVAFGYARTMIKQGAERHYDPLSQAAMACFESHWNPRTINASDPGYSIGLMQVAAVRKRSKCPSKALIHTKPCQDKIALLMDGNYSLVRGAMGITIRRKWCRKHHGRAPFVGWLSSYQGMDRPKNGKPGERICNMQRDKRGRWQPLPVRKVTKRVIDYRLALIRKYAR